LVVLIEDVHTGWSINYRAKVPIEGKRIKARFETTEIANSSQLPCEFSSFRDQSNVRAAQMRLGLSPTRPFNPMARLMP
jgi:hypothetical protein